MFAIFIVITIFALVLTIFLSIVEDKRRKYENEQLKNNLKKLDDGNRL
tara:strand:- start:33 stop:176 length:144 start_codon:yes stop_codon:yes gene_type:complete